VSRVRRLGDVAGLEQARRLAAELFAVFAAAGVVVKAVGGPTWLAVGLAVVGAVGALVTLGLVWLQERARRRELLLRPPVRLREQAASRGFYELGVETEAQEAVALVGGRAYVPRDVHPHLVRAMRRAAGVDRASLIVVSGPAKAGKSRAAMEAAAAALPDAWLLCPACAEALRELARVGCPPEVRPGQVSVLWLDDIEMFARPGGRGLGPDTIEVLDGWEGPVVVLATHGGKGVALAGPEATRFQETTSDLLRRHPPFRLAADLSETERLRASEMYGEDPATRLKAAGIGEFMIAAPQLVNRLENERDCPEGRAVALAAIDCQRSGLVRPLKVEWLEELYGHHLPGPATPERFHSGLEWATRPIYSRVALLVGEENGNGYHPYDYVVAYVERRGDRIAPAVLDKVVGEYADSEQDLLLVGAAAYRRGDEERAASAWRRADDDGSFYGAFNLGLLLERRGDTQAAEAAYARADKRGDADLAGHLGMNVSVAIERLDYVAQEGLYRRSDERGDPDAAVRLGLLLSRRGDSDAAEDAFRRAEERGSFNGAFNLAVIRMRRGDLSGAEAAFRRAEQLRAA
jgi:tetratricopeptide (TPR) repeat protein